MFAPIDCEGACAIDGACYGLTRQVHVYDATKDWGTFRYCQEAVATDRKAGFTVESIDQAHAQEPPQ